MSKKLTQEQENVIKEIDNAMPQEVKTAFEENDKIDAQIKILEQSKQENNAIIFSDSSYFEMNRLKKKIKEE